MEGVLADSDHLKRSMQMSPWRHNIFWWILRVQTFYLMDWFTTLPPGLLTSAVWLLKSRLQKIGADLIFLFSENHLLAKSTIAPEKQNSFGETRNFDFWNSFVQWHYTFLQCCLNPEFSSGYHQGSNFFPSSSSLGRTWAFLLPNVVSSCDFTQDIVFFYHSFLDGQLMLAEYSFLLAHKKSRDCSPPLTCPLCQLFSYFRLYYWKRMVPWQLLDGFGL